MRRLILALSACATMLAGSMLQAAPQRVFPVADKPVVEDRFPAQPVLFPKGVKAYRDVAYQQLPGFIPQVVDIYIPATKGPHPLVLYIHGGGWVGGHTRHSGALADFPSVLAALAAEGFTVASLEYRLSGEAKFPAQLQDAKAALRFLGANASKYRIDTSRVGVWGGSAGGHLTALTALTCHDTSLDPQAAKDVCATAAVTWYGVFDFAKMAGPDRPGGDQNAALLLGCNAPCPADKFAWASPVTYIDAKDPPFLLIHGTEDKTVPVGQSREAEAAFKAAGVPVQAIYIPGVDHSFIGSTPQQTRAATLQAVNATFDFFHAKLGVPQ
ncbi:MAG: alpha/beta hydrolase [Sphingomonadales bacterium]|nr:alpha/beta hydrolase [Sphingomonadales bacterium]